MLHYVHSQFCAIRELFSDQELTHSSIDKLETFPQLISNEVFVYQISCGYVSKFLDHETFLDQVFGSWELATSYGGFPLITSFLGMITVYFFKVLKTIDFSTSVPNVLFIDRLYNVFHTVRNWALFKLFLPNVVHV